MYVVVYLGLSNWFNSVIIHDTLENVRDLSYTPGVKIISVWKLPTEEVKWRERI